jgi:hypothetical protein
MSGYTEKDAAKDTDATPREVARAHHAARDHSGVRSGSGEDRPTEQNQRDARRKWDEMIERGKARDRERPPEANRER